MFLLDLKVIKAFSFTCEPLSGVGGGAQGSRESGGHRPLALPGTLLRPAGIVGAPQFSCSGVQFCGLWEFSFQQAAAVS